MSDIRVPIPDSEHQPNGPGNPHFSHDDQPNDGNAHFSGDRPPSTHEVAVPSDASQLKQDWEAFLRFREAQAAERAAIGETEPEPNAIDESDTETRISLLDRVRNLGDYITTRAVVGIGAVGLIVSGIVVGSKKLDESYTPEDAPTVPPATAPQTVAPSPSNPNTAPNLSPGQQERVNLKLTYAKLGPMVAPEWYDLVTTEVDVNNTEYADEEKVAGNINRILNNIAYAVETNNENWQDGLRASFKQVAPGKYDPDIQDMVNHSRAARESSLAKREQNPDARVVVPKVERILAIYPGFRNPNTVSVHAEIYTPVFDSAEQQVVAIKLQDAHIDMEYSETVGWPDGSTNKMWVFSAMNLGPATTQNIQPTNITPSPE